jgi:hypothetical protein
MGISKRQDKMFVWGPESQTVYALSRRLPPIRYVANFHINDYSAPDEEFKKIQANPPKVIVVLPNAPDFDKLQSLINEQYITVNEVDGATIYLHSPVIAPHTN